MTNALQTGPNGRPFSAVLSVGLRPFFLLGATWAALAMVLWIVVLTGRLDLPSRFDPVSWHAHALLFGYLGAIFAGFLLTAVPNWTRRPALRGWPLLGLVILWAAGRISVVTSALWPVTSVILIDLSFPVVLGAFILREVIASQNWRNLIIVGMLATFTLANLLFHIDAALGGHAAQGIGARLGLAASLMMITVIGGRIIPSFTRNWFKKTGRNIHPANPMQSFDKVVLLVTLVTLALWVAIPELKVVGVAMLALAGLHAARLVRWKGLHTTSEPLVFVLHVGYAFVPLGALAKGVSLLWPDYFELAAAQHIWMAGAIGLMTLAVMTRASLGHTGQNLNADAGTALIFISIVGSVASRVFASIWPSFASLHYQISGLFWIVAFGGFVALYGGLLTRPKAQGAGLTG